MKNILQALPQKCIHISCQMSFVEHEQHANLLYELKTETDWWNKGSVIIYTRVGAEEKMVG